MYIYMGYFKALIFAVLLFICPLYAIDLQLNWFENTEPDLAGYTIYFGNHSRLYDQKVSTGLVNSYVLKDLEEKVVYYFAITAFDTAGNESAYSAESMCILNDTTPLKIDSVIVLSLNDLEIVYNKKVTTETAEKIENYYITPDIDIQKAVLQTDAKSVRLVTGEHAFETSYQLSVDNISDIALPANTLPETQLNYTVDAQQIDHIPPVVASVEPLTDVSILVYFDEPINANLDSAQFSISPNISVLSFEQISANVIKIQTAPHQQNDVYTLNVKNVSDNSVNVNTIADDSRCSYSIIAESTNAPIVELWNVPEKNHVQLMFNSAPGILDENDFVISGITIHNVSMDSSGRMLNLFTSNHKVGEIYKLEYMGNSQSIVEPFTVHYEYTTPDTLAPVLQKIRFLNDSEICLHFSGSLEENSALDVQNYVIDNSISVLNAELSFYKNIVTLETTPHTVNSDYSIQLHGIVDNTYRHNRIDSTRTFNYTFSDTKYPRITKIVQLDSVMVDVYFNDRLDPVTAQNISNYSYGDTDMQLFDVQLSNDGIIVRLTTSPHQEGKIYSLQTQNILFFDNGILPAGYKNVYHYEYLGKDLTGPVIRTIRAKDEENLYVLFSEALDETSAQDVRNYTISDGIQVLSAVLNAERDIVHLETSTHDKKQNYTLQIENICDSSMTMNVCPDEHSFIYTVDLPDDQPPYIEQVKVLASDKIVVLFNEPVSGANVTQSRNYYIDHDIDVTAVNTTYLSNRVELTTTLMEPKVYQLYVNNIADRSGNIPDGNPYFYFSYSGMSTTLQVTNVEPLSSNELLLTFSHDLETASAVNENNYAIDKGVQVLSARMDDKDNQVIITTSDHVAETEYLLTVENVTDKQKKRTAEKEYTRFQYYFHSGYSNKLAIESVSLTTPEQIELKFDQKVNWQSAENIENYTIEPFVELESVTLADDDQTVILQSYQHFQAIPYTLRVSDVVPVDDSIETSDSYYGVYHYLSLLDVLLPDNSAIDVEYVQVGKPYYTDRDYVLTAVPEVLEGSRMIKTPNDDKSNEAPDYLPMSLTQNAVIYIAYDSRVESVPQWLNEKFKKTSLPLGVTDQVEKLDIWRGYFKSGELTLGGNSAEGAVNAKSMYVVFVAEPTQEVVEDILNGDKTDENGEIPETFVLYQNYPNPFNPSTTIRFDLNADQYVTLQVFNVLGRKVKTLYDAYAPAGYYEVDWQGVNETGNKVAAGLYFYRFEMRSQEGQGGTRTFVKKMLLIR